MRAQTDVAMPDPPRVHCVACGEVDQIQITPGVGLTHIFCRRCYAQSFIQDGAEASDR